MKKLLSLLLAAITVLSLFACTADKEQNENDGDDVLYSSSDIALSSENFSFTRAEVSYLFHKNYSDFKYSDPDTVDFYKIDTDASLKDQVYYDDYTWFQFFADTATDYMQEVLILCEGALAAGIELDDEDRATIDETIKSWTDYAEKYEYTEKELFGKFFNEEVNTSVMKSFLEKDALSAKYRSALVSEYEFTDDMIKEYVEKNRDNFYYIDYLKYTIDEDDVSTPKATAQTFANAKTADEFLSLVSDYITDTLKKDEDEKTADLEECSVIGEQKKTYGTFSPWAFGGASDNQTFIEEDEVDGEYTVYFLTRAPYLDTVPTRNIRIISDNVSSYSKYQDVVDHLNELLDDWKEKGGTEEEFAKLAQSESDDADTRDNGGYVGNMTQFDTSLGEKVRTWVFSDERKAGDTEIILGEGCYYAVYFCGEDIPGWQLNSELSLAQEKLENQYDELADKYSVTVNDKVIASLEG